jgi:hypothetical protein
VIDHHGNIDPGQQRFDVRQSVRFEVQDHVPPELLDLRCDRQQIFGRILGDQSFEEIESNASNSAPVHGLEVLVPDIRPHGRHPAGGLAEEVESIEHCRIVSTVARGLDDH